VLAISELLQSWETLEDNNCAKFSSLKLCLVLLIQTCVSSFLNSENCYPSIDVGIFHLYLVVLVLIWD